jgi:hypothetical protein
MQPDERRTRITRYGLLSAICAALCMTGLVAAPGSADATSTVTVEVPVRACAPPAPGHDACMAMGLEPRRLPAGSPAAINAAIRTAQLDERARSRAAGTLAAGPTGGYTPQQIAAAYGLNVHAAAAATQTVGIVDAYQDPDALSDLDLFDRHYGIPQETAKSFSVVNQDGDASPLPADDTSGWATEVALDVEAVRSVCRRCRILLVEANSDGGSDLADSVNTAVRLGATEVSNSYGAAEGNTAAPASVVGAYNHPGVVITASSGDDGWYGWDEVASGGSSGNSPQQPAAFNTVIGVGGTTLDLNANGTRSSESVWNDDGTLAQSAFPKDGRQGATGGGCSTVEDAQRFQADVADYASLGCGKGKRSAVDIAADGDSYTGLDVYRSYDEGAGSTGWITMGGTSLSSPLIAGMWALAGGAGGVKYPALSLYGHFRSDPDTYDITVGSNGFCGIAAPSACASDWGSNPNASMAPNLVDCAFGTTSSVAVDPHRGQCYAQPGYDGVSGVGSPRGTGTFTPMFPAISFTSKMSVKAGTSLRLAAKVSDPFPGGRISKYAWDLGGVRSTNVHPTVRYRSAGTHRVTLTVTDNYGQSASKRITLTVKS